MSYKNKEGYADPCAGEAMKRLSIDDIAKEVLTAVCNLIFTSGFRVKNIEIEHRASGRIFTNEDIKNRDEE